MVIFQQPIIFGSKLALMNNKTMRTETQDQQPVEEKADSSFSTGRVLQTVILIAAVLATLFTLWNPYKLFSQDNITQSDQFNTSDLETSEQKTIGILVGHWNVDSGSVCENGITEADVNEAIANQVSIKMNALGYPVRLFAQTDLDLINFRGQVLVAIFSGPCENTPANKSGFTIGTILNASDLNASNALAVCMGEIYQSSTDLDFTYEIITPDHSAYTLFEMVNPGTPMIYLEMGSLYLDQTLLLEESEKVANGIVNGILCYLDTLENNE